MRLGDLHIFLNRLLGEVQHMRGEQWLAVLREVLLVGLEQTVEPARFRIKGQGSRVKGQGSRVKG